MKIFTIRLIIIFTLIMSSIALIPSTALQASRRINATTPYNVTQSAQILKVDSTNETSIMPIAYVNQVEDRAAAHGDWESSGILDASKYFGDGAWLVDVQAHTIDEVGQVLLMRIPES